MKDSAVGRAGRYDKKKKIISRYSRAFLRRAVRITIRHLANTLSAERQQRRQKRIRLNLTMVFFNAYKKTKQVKL